MLTSSETRAASSYYDEYLRSKGGKAKADPGRLLTDRSAYLSFLEVQLERVTAACMTARGFSDRIEQVQRDIIGVQEKTANLSKALKLSHEFVEQQEEESARSVRALAAELEDVRGALSQSEATMRSVREEVRLGAPAQQAARWEERIQAAEGAVAQAVDSMTVLRRRCDQVEGQVQAALADMRSGQEQSAAAVTAVVARVQELQDKVAEAAAAAVARARAAEERCTTQHGQLAGRVTDVQSALSRALAAARADAQEATRGAEERATAGAREVQHALQQWRREQQAREEAAAERAAQERLAAQDAMEEVMRRLAALESQCGGAGDGTLAKLVRDEQAGALARRREVEATARQAAEGRQAAAGMMEEVVARSEAQLRRFMEALEAMGARVTSQLAHAADGEATESRIAALEESLRTATAACEARDVDVRASVQEVEADARATALAVAKAAGRSEHWDARLAHFRDELAERSAEMERRVTDTLMQSAERVAKLAAERAGGRFTEQAEQRVQERLAAWRAEIDEAQRRLAAASSDARIRTDGVSEQLRAELHELRDQVAKLDIELAEHGRQCSAATAAAAAAAGASRPRSSRAAAPAEQDGEAMSSSKTRLRARRSTEGTHSSDDSGSRREDSGSRREESGSRRADSGSRREDSGSRRADSGSRREDSGSRREDSGSRRRALRAASARARKPAVPRLSSAALAAAPEARGTKAAARQTRLRELYQQIAQLESTAALR